MDAMSFGLMLSIFHSIPSTRTRGELEDDVNEPIPRILIVAPLLPGCPDDCVTFIPAARPAKAAEVLTMTRPSLFLAKSIDATDPVRLTFFWTP